MSCNEIEKEIQAKGLTAPRVTRDDIEDAIASQYFFTAADAVSPNVEQMAGRFLGWKLPKDFAPDSGISFAPISDPLMWPTGTNLMHHGQAVEMFKHATDYDEAPEALRLLTFCVLVLRNGFTVTGESACASPENFDADIGRKIARDNAIDKVWMLEGYLLKQKLADQAAT